MSELTLELFGISWIPEATRAPTSVRITRTCQLDGFIFCLSKMWDASTNRDYTSVSIGADTSLGYDNSKTRRGKSCWRVSKSSRCEKYI